MAQGLSVSPYEPEVGDVVTITQNLYWRDLIKNPPRNDDEEQPVVLRGSVWQVRAFNSMFSGEEQRCPTIEPYPIRYFSTPPRYTVRPDWLRLCAADGVRLERGI